MRELIPVIAISLFLALVSDLFSKKDERLNHYVSKEKFLWIFIIIAMSLFAAIKHKKYAVNITGLGTA